MLTQPLTLSGRKNEYQARGSGSIIRQLDNKGNHRSGIAPAMHKRVYYLSTYALSGLKKRDEHSPVCLHFCKEYGTLYQGGHKPGNLKYSGNSLNLENPENSQGIQCNVREKL